MSSYNRYADFNAYCFENIACIALASLLPLNSLFLSLSTLSPSSSLSLSPSISFFLPLSPFLLSISLFLSFPFLSHWHNFLRNRDKITSLFLTYFFGLYGNLWCFRIADILSRWVVLYLPSTLTVVLLAGPCCSPLPIVLWSSLKHHRQYCGRSSENADLHVEDHANGGIYKIDTSTSMKPAPGRLWSQLESLQKM